MVTAKQAAAGRGSCSQSRERRTKPGAWATPGLEPGGLSRGTGTQENPELEVRGQRWGLELGPPVLGRWCGRRAGRQGCQVELRATAAADG